MPETLTVEAFLERAQPHAPVVDVRSPAEFAQGHISGAVNVPLFSDAERAEIGTAYVRQGRHSAVMLGLARVGPRLEELGTRLSALAAGPQRELLIHCWRGGMRSASVAWLAETLDCRVATLTGGYKAFRRWVIDEGTTARCRIRVLSGLTGTGKTRVLQALAERGESVIDLEKLARHKGSVFGDLGEERQPTQEQFENDLAMALRHAGAGTVVWVEDESRNIGKCTLPEPFWQAKQAAPHHVLELPLAARLAHLCEVYRGHAREQLAARIQGIGKRLGGERTAAAIQALNNGDFAQACALVLAYYDRSYQQSLQKVPADRLQTLACDDLDPPAIAKRLCRSDFPPDPQ